MNVKDTALKIFRNKAVRIAVVGLAATVAASLGFDIDVASVLALFGG